MIVLRAPLVLVEPSGCPGDRRAERRAVRSLAREAVAGRAGVEPAHVRFGVVAAGRSRGRPVVMSPQGLQVSFAHIPGMVAVAVGVGGPVGVDVETRERVHRCRQGVMSLLTPATRRAASTSADPDLALAAEWVTREALVKCGLGALDDSLLVRATRAGNRGVVTRQGVGATSVWGVSLGCVWACAWREGSDSALGGDAVESDLVGADNQLHAGLHVELRHQGTDRRLDARFGEVARSGNLGVGTAQTDVGQHLRLAISEGRDLTGRVGCG